MWKNKAMLKSQGKVSLWFRLGSRIFVCLPNRRLSGPLRAIVRPWVIGWMACWCDRSTAS